MTDHRGWHQLRNLPHFDREAVVQSITYWLSDALPKSVAERLSDEMTDEAEPRYRRRIETFLDTGYGSCCLSRAVLATSVIETWVRFAGERYDLKAWVVMPNHVHVIIAVRAGWPLAKIVQSWKSWTGKRIKAATMPNPVTWQREYWDRYIRDEAHFLQAVAYIHDNPVKAGLCRLPEEWPWSSTIR